MMTTILIIALISTSGCVGGKNRQTQTTQTTQPQTTQTTQPPEKDFDLETCADLGGYICDVGEECEGKWLDAFDTFSCCSERCESTLEDKLVIDPFDVNPENEDLGDVT